MTRALAKRSELQQLAEQWVKLTKRVLSKARDYKEATEIAVTLAKEQGELRQQVATIQADLTARLFSAEEPENQVRAIQLSDGNAILALKGSHCQLLEVVQ